jgi:hypothetical protein
VTRPEDRPAFQIVQRVEPHVTDADYALKRGLKFLLRACGLRAVSAVEVQPDPANQTAHAFDQLRRDVAARHKIIRGRQ